MATSNHVQAAQKNIGKAQQAARGRRRGGNPGRALEDRNRQQLYDIARKQGIAGRSKVGEWELIEVIRRSR
jgi:hypothetical protein